MVELLGVIVFTAADVILGEAVVEKYGLPFTPTGLDLANVFMFPSQTNNPLIKVIFFNFQKLQ